MYAKEEEFLAMFDQATKKDHRCLIYTNRVEIIEDSYF